MKAAALKAPIRAITFDLDFTLWDLTGVIDRAEQRAHEWLSAHHPKVTARWEAVAMAELRQRIAAERPDLRHDVTELRRSAYREAGRVSGYEAEALEEMVDGVFDEFLTGRHEVNVYADAGPLLDDLHGRVCLGAITNGNAEVRRIGLDGYFDFTLSAVEIGTAKPSHLVFETAANRAGAPPECIVHVGDDAECDVVGAARAGFQAVWLNRDDVPWPEGLEQVPYVEVRDLQALGTVLRSLL